MLRLRSLINVLVFLLSILVAGCSEEKEERTSYNFQLQLIEEIPLKGGLLSGGHRLVKEDDQYLILDTGHKKVYSFSEQGQLLQEFEGKAQLPDSVSFPVSLVTDEEGRSYVLDAQAKNVQVFNSDGDHIRTYKIDSGGVQMAVSGGHFYIYDSSIYNDNRPMVYAYNMETGKLVDQISPASDMMKGFQKGFVGSSLMGLAVAEDKLLTLQHPIQLRVRIYDNATNKLLSTLELNSDYFQKAQVDNYKYLQVNLEDVSNALVTGFFAEEDRIYLVYTEFGTGEKYMDIFNFEGNLLNAEPVALGRKWPRYLSENGYFYSFAWADSANTDPNKATVKLKKYQLQEQPVSNAATQ